jgi:magnesium-transporting ATPase (P-type)
MDSLASLALATEDPKEDLLERPPYRKKEYIISQKMVKHILGMSMFQAVILFTFVFGAPYFISEECDPRTGPLYISHPLSEISS